MNQKCMWVKRANNSKKKLQSCSSGEMVTTMHSKCVAEKLVGSSPTSSTKCKMNVRVIE